MCLILTRLVIYTNDVMAHSVINIFISFFFLFFSREMNKHLRDEQDMCFQVCSPLKDFNSNHESIADAGKTLDPMLKY